MSAENRFADFVLFEKLGRTALGTTFRAGHMAGNMIDRHVRLLRFDHPAIDHEAFWQLVSDRRPLLRSLRDPHLGNATDLGREGMFPYVAYPYLSGTTLARFLAVVRERRFPVSTDQALFIIERVALALTAAHGVVHRGRPVLHGFLVPELIHLSNEGEIRILGIEVAPGLRSQLVDKAEYAPYLAPEVRSGLSSAETDDVYSLGALLLELLSGGIIEAKDSEAAERAITEARLANGEPLPRTLRVVLRNSLAPADDRIANAVDWQRAVGRLILEGDYNPTTFNLSYLLHTLFRSNIEKELASLARESAVRLASGTSPAAASAASSVELAAAAAGPRHPFLVGFMTSFVGALAIVAGFFFLRGGLVASTSDTEEAVPPSRVEASEATGAYEPADEDPSSTPVAEASPPTREKVVIESTTGEPEIVLDPRLQAVVDRRSRDLEADLRQQYEAELEALRRQVEEARRPASGAGETARRPATAREPGEDSSRPSSLQPSATPQAAGEPSETGAREDTNTPPRAREVPQISSIPRFEPPSFLSCPRPVYPAAAQRLRRSANAQVRVLVDVEGQVREAEIEGPPLGLGFDEAALEAARRSQWTPATSNGENVEAWAEITLQFRP